MWKWLRQETTAPRWWVLLMHVLTVKVLLDSKTLAGFMAGLFGW